MLIKNWKQAWRFLSVQAAVAAAMADVLSDSSPLIKEWLGDGWMKYAAIAIIVGRLIGQSAEVVDDPVSAKRERKWVRRAQRSYGYQGPSEYEGPYHDDRYGEKGE